MGTIIEIYRPNRNFGEGRGRALIRLQRLAMRGCFCVFLSLASFSVHGEDLSVAQYFPLAVGNRWVYQIQDRTDGAPPAMEYWDIQREEQGRFILRIRQSNLTTGGFEESFLPTPDGIKRIAAETTRKEDPPFFLKGPLREGTTWVDEDGTYEITGADKTLTVPAGEFSRCIEITNTRQGGKATVITLFAPGVGMVQRHETYPILEGSGSFYPQRQDQALLQLREWHLTP